MEKKEEKPTEEKPEETKAGQIEVIPNSYTYVVEVDGERIGTENVETAVILSKLEKIDQAIKELQNKK
jgi:hypothetical protein